MLLDDEAEDGISAALRPDEAWLAIPVCVPPARFGGWLWLWLWLWPKRLTKDAGPGVDGCAMLKQRHSPKTIAGANRPGLIQRQTDDR